MDRDEQPLERRRRWPPRVSQGNVGACGHKNQFGDEKDVNANEIVWMGSEVRTAFIGSYGFGNLGDELCLIEALERFKTDDAWVFSDRPEFTSRFVKAQGFFTERGQLSTIKPSCVVLGGGGIGFWPSLRDSLHWMHDCLGWGAECHIHNIGVGKITQPEWISDKVVREVITKVASFTVRDHISRWLVLEWGFDRDPGLTFYPERTLEPDMSLAETLPDGPLLGVSITGQNVMKEALRRNRHRIDQLLQDFKYHSILPIVSTLQPGEPEEDDIAGFNNFAELYLSGRQIVLPEALDRTWWHDNLTPLRLKGLVAKCDFLLSQRKHNILHAIGANVPFIAIHPSADDSLVRIIYALNHEAAPRSGFLSLP